MSAKPKYTYEVVKEIVENRNYKLLSKPEDIVNVNGFVLTKTKINVWCGNMEHQSFQPTLGHFIMGTTCSKCSRIIWSKEKIIEYVEENNYNFIEFIKFDKLNSIIKIWCKNPMHEPYKINFSYFRKNARCKECNYEKARERYAYSYKYVKEYIESFGHKLISKEYKNSRSELEISCPNKKHKSYKTTLMLFKKSKYKCPECRSEHLGDWKRLNYNCVKDYIESFGYKMISTHYRTARDKIIIQCQNSHEPYKTTYDKFKQGYRCPHCSQPKGEKYIEEILNIHNIQYETQYKFKDCKLYRTLPFDFYLPDYNCCVEFDGRQHYEIIKYFGGLDRFIDTKIRDTIKTEYCKNNNIKLIRIPYWEMKDIENILINKLNLK